MPLVKYNQQAQASSAGKARTSMKFRLKRIGWDGLQRECAAALDNPTSKLARELGKLLARKFAEAVQAEVRRREIRGENPIDHLMVSIEIHLEEDPLLVPDHSYRRRNLIADLDDIVSARSVKQPEGGQQ